MKFVLSACLLFLLAKGTFTQEGFDLSDALDDVEPTPPKAEAPANPKDDDGFDLFDALGPDEPKKPNKPKPNPGGSDPNEKPDKPAIKPPKPGGGGGSSFDDKDLYDLGGGEYKPEGGGGRADQPYDTGDQPQDPDLPWRQILKMLISNMPEEFFMWLSNTKQILERILELVQTLV
ncbi:CD99 molecule isoform X5 [Nerophis lumbriciformis]|uniref:CD99 molecule isoform X5 n=1 Tax=Nerophis lumbriciformis TaxID=546530 RepID=UPI002AE09E84|nr:CD99 molecule isoform X5 [Nerophis lumbriciformis]